MSLSTANWPDFNFAVYVSVNGDVISRPVVVGSKLRGCGDPLRARNTRETAPVRSADSVSRHTQQLHAEYSSR